MILVLFVSPSVRERGTDTADTMPLEEEVMETILRAKTLELGQVEEEEQQDPVEPSQQTHGLTRKSAAAFPNGGDHAPGVAKVGAGDQGTGEEKEEGQPQKTIPVETVKTSPEKIPDEFPDRPVVTRDSQRELKQSKEVKEKETNPEGQPSKGGRKGKGRGKGLKRPAAARDPKPKTKKDDEEGEGSEELENEVGATQHYSPSKSPLEPQDLEPAFAEVADAEPAAPVPKKPRKSKTTPKEDKESEDTSKRSKRKTDTKDDDQQPAKKPRTTKTTTKEGKKDDKPTKGGKKTNPMTASTSTGKDNDGTNESKDSKSQGLGLVRVSGGPRVSFAGRLCPKSEQAKNRFEVMVMTYNTHVRPYVDLHSQVEVGWVQTIYSEF